MTTVIDLAGYIEEGQPVATAHQRTQFWPSSTQEETAYAWRQQGKDSESVRRKEKAQREGMEGEHVTCRTMLVSEHGPTHVDAFTHLDPTEDRSIDRMDLDWFYGPTICVDVSHVRFPDYITRGDIEEALDEENLSIEDGDIILLYTGHRERHYGVDSWEDRYHYTHDYTGLDREAAEWLVDEGVKNIGVDSPSIDHASYKETAEFPGHDVGAERNVTNMENLANLSEVAGMRFTLYAFPLKIRGGTGSPIRPIAFVAD